MSSRGSQSPFCCSDFDSSSWLSAVPGLPCLQPRRTLGNFTPNFISRGGGQAEGHWEDPLLSEKSLPAQAPQGPRQHRTPSLSRLPLGGVIAHQSSSFNRGSLHTSFSSFLPCPVFAKPSPPPLIQNGISMTSHWFTQFRLHKHVPLLTVVYIHWLACLFNIVFLIRMSPPHRQRPCLSCSLLSPEGL